MVDALASLDPAVVVYECVDAYHHTPGITGRWADIQERAERELVALSDVVVVPGEALARRFRSWGGDVRVVSHGVDLFPWQGPRLRDGSQTVIGFVGTLDYRLDMAVLAYIARVRPDWRLRLIGPVQEGFDRGALRRFPNVSIELPVPHQRLGEVLAGFDAGLMAYADTPIYHYMTPLKTLELLAAGRPVVARPSPALAPFATLLYLATTPQDFVDELERSIREDSHDLARRRRTVAEENIWDRRMEELVGIVEELLDDDGRSH